MENAQQEKPRSPPSAERVFRVSTTSTHGHGSRRTSLTIPEHALLQSLSGASVGAGLKESEKKDVGGHDLSNSASGSSHLGIAKQDLTKSIMARGDALSSAERTFLEQLAASETSSVDTLVHATHVLEKDPLYNKTEEKDQQALVQETRAHKETHRRLSQIPIKEDVEKPQQTLQREPMFRREMWTHYSSRWLADNNESLNTVNEESSKMTPDITQQKHQKKNGIVSFFKHIFPKKDDGVVDKVQNAEDMIDELAFCILATSVNDKEVTPHVLSPPIMDALRPAMPFSVRQDNYWLKYSMMRDGASVYNLLRCVRGSSRTILAIETMDGEVFGSFTSSPWRVRGTNYYGSGEAFLWRMKRPRFTPCKTVDEQIALESDVEIFAWTGKNRNVQYLKSDESELIIGGGPPDDDDEIRSDWGFALAISNDLVRGTSAYSVTFDNPPILTSNKEVFEVANLEVWTLSPVDNVEQAEKIELSRQFIFENSSFIDQ